MVRLAIFVSFVLLLFRVGFHEVEAVASVAPAPVTRVSTIAGPTVVLNDAATPTVGLTMFPASPKPFDLTTTTLADHGTLPRLVEAHLVAPAE